MDQPFNAINDPLGQLINLQAKARQQRFSDTVANPMSQLQGPLHDPQWDAWFDSVDDAAGGKPVKFAGGTDPTDPKRFSGVHTPQDFVGSEQYGGSHPSIAGYQAASTPALTGLQSAAKSPTPDPMDRALFYPGADTYGGVDKQAMAIKRAAKNPQKAS